MISFVIALVFSSCITAFADQPFILRDCAAKDNAMIILKSASVTPDPIAIPGSVKVSGVAELFKDAADAKLNLVVEVQRYLGFFWITVPCISNVGSCTYDVCDLIGHLNDTCPPELVANNVPCSCATLKKGVYSLTDQKFDIPTLSGVWSWLATGDYKLDMKLVDPASGQEVACLHGEATMVDGDDCDGFLCSIFG